MTAGKHLDIELEPLPGDTPLELDGKEAIIATGEDSRVDVWPRVERPSLVEDGRPLGGGVRIGTHDGGDIWGQIVEKQGLQIAHIRWRPPVSYSRGLSRGVPSDVVPPFPGCLPRLGNHGVDEDDARHIELIAGQRCAEASERLGNQHQLATHFSRRCDDEVSILHEPRIGVGPW